MLASRPIFDIAAIAEEFQTMLTSQLRDEFLIRLRFRAAQLVIEMDDG
jgi:hypothetical protein